MLRPVTVMACDWNGTLVHDRDRAWSATCTVLERRGLAVPSLEEFLDEFHLPLGSLFARYGVVGGTQDAIADWNRAMGRLPTEAMPGARQLLERCSQAGIVVAVVSAASGEVIEGHLALLGLRDYVRVVFGDSDPKRAALRKLADAHGGPVAFLGDTEYDMREANAAGAIAIGFAGGYRPSAALIEGGAVYVADRLEDVALLVVDGLPERAATSLDGTGGQPEQQATATTKFPDHDSVTGKEEEE